VGVETGNEWSPSDLVRLLGLWLTDISPLSGPVTTW
jgi:hypothetical protein